ncbi:myotrophin [Bacillus rossius redtenbacheri]|uniref:myotrophin n=1 Tax=Bacillus rossius redtenbacheri TaxID=93214 RepID=UPI002FDD88D2
MHLTKKFPNLACCVCSCSISVYCYDLCLLNFYYKFCVCNLDIMSDLVWGIKNGDLDQVKDFVENKEVDVNKEIDGRPPIHYAADYGQKDVIKYLISRGADVNLKDKHGISALLAAVWEGHTDCVKILIENGASKTGSTPDGLSYVEAADKEEIKELLK